MEKHTPAYFRARLDTFRHFIKEELPGHPLFDTGQKNSPLELLKQGYVHPDIRERFENRLESFERSGIKLPVGPLSFTELSSFNTWFAMYPEKVAGEETITSSRDFPITVTGTKEDIMRVIGSHRPEGRDKRARIARAKAAAKQKLLELLKTD